jgi:hypothetical protein
MIRHSSSLRRPQDLDRPVVGPPRNPFTAARPFGLTRGRQVEVHEPVVSAPFVNRAPDTVGERLQQGVELPILEARRETDRPDAALLLARLERTPVQEALARQDAIVGHQEVAHEAVGRPPLHAKVRAQRLEEGRLGAVRLRGGSAGSRTGTASSRRKAPSTRTASSRTSGSSSSASTTIGATARVGSILASARIALDPDAGVGMAQQGTTGRTRSPLRSSPARGRDSAPGTSTNRGATRAGPARRAGRPSPAPGTSGRAPGGRAPRPGAS